MNETALGRSISNQNFLILLQFHRVYAGVCLLWRLENA